MITVKNRRMIVPPEEKFLGVETDTNSSIRVFRIPRYITHEIDLSSLAFFLDIRYEDNTTNETAFIDMLVSENSIDLTWYITANDLGSEGAIFLQLKANDLSGKVKWKSFIEPFFVGDCIDAAGQYTGGLSAYEALVTRCVIIENREVARMAAEELRQTNTTNAINNANDAAQGAIVATSGAIIATDRAEHAAEVVEGIVAEKIGINDYTVSLSEGWSSYKINSELAEISSLSTNIYSYPLIGAEADDTGRLQRAINATPIGGKLYCGAEELHVSSTPQINQPIAIIGTSQYISRIVAHGCNGIKVNKTSNVIFVDIEIAQAVRHTTTPNTFIGIEVDGDTVNRPFNHFYSNVYIDGFYVAFKGNWLWSSVFDNFKCGFCQRGLAIYGLSVNNVVSNSSLGMSNLAGSIGIVFAGDVASEGWIITNTLINDAEIGIYGIANTHIKVSNCILDHMGVFGIRIQGYLTNFGGNWTITNNYIAMNGSSGDCAISCDNAIANVQNRGNVIANNDILVYATKSCLKGISMSGAESKYNIITGNVIKGFTDYDIYAPIASQIVTDNQCLSSITTNINSVGVLSNNVGKVYYRRGTNNSNIGAISVTYDEATPTIAGNRGDLCINITSTVGINGFWSCTVSGGSGVAVWEPLGIVGAVKLASQSDSTASDVTGLKADFNALLAKLRTAKLM